MNCLGNWRPADLFHFVIMLAHVTSEMMNQVKMNALENLDGMGILFILAGKPISDIANLCNHFPFQAGFFPDLSQRRFLEFFPLLHLAFWEAPARSDSNYGDFRRSVELTENNAAT